MGASRSKAGALRRGGRNRSGSGEGGRDNALMALVLCS